MKRIEFGEYRTNDTTRSYVLNCLDANWISMGPMVQKFEQEWCKLFGYKHARAVSSGTAAGMAACMALYDLGAKPGDEIVCPALSFIATANAIRAAGFTPRFVDVKLETMNIDEEQIEAAINERTVAIKVVNLMGRPAELAKIRAIADNHEIPVICDNCEGYGCRHKGKPSLAYCAMETASFYAAHMLCCGEGGMVSTNNPLLDVYLESIRNHGRTGGSAYFNHTRYGLNLKMSDLHAAVALGGIRDFDVYFTLRRSIVSYLRSSLRGLEDKAWFTEEALGDVNAPHGFSITLKPAYKDSIGDFRKCLDAASIHWKRNFGNMLHHDALSFLRPLGGDFPNAIYIGNFGLHVGCHQYLSLDDLEYMGKTLRTFLEGLRG